MRNVSQVIDCCPGAFKEKDMDIKEVIKRIEKAFPGWKISCVDKAHAVESDDYYNKLEAWQIAIYKPKKDDKK